MRGILITAMAMFAVVLMGCSEVREPWVSNDEQLAGERSRPAEQAHALRDRLASGQIDR